MREWFQNTVQKLTQSRCLWIAFSGGLDSSVLLDLTVRTFSQLPEYHVTAIHIHDGLSVHADAWVAHCRKICQSYQVPLEVRWIDASPKRKQSPEESSRIARYEALRGCMEIEDCLLLAHHQEDQAETILLRLFRGAGPLGLSGMQERVVLQEKEMIRPFLSVPKAQLIQYALENKLVWVEDDLNQALQFDRNYVRHHLMPLLKKRWPKVSETITRSGQLCGKIALVVEETMHEKLQEALGATPYVLSVKRLLALEEEHQGHVLRLWLKNLGYSMPSHAHISRILKEVVSARPGAKPRLKIDQYEIYRIQDQLGVRPWKMPQ